MKSHFVASVNGYTVIAHLIDRKLIHLFILITDYIIFDAKDPSFYLHHCGEVLLYYYSYIL